MSSAEGPATAAPAAAGEKAPWLANLLRPILAFRLRYLPLVMVYFAYGALGLIDVAYTHPSGARPAKHAVTAR